MKSVLGKWKPRVEYGECGYDNSDFAASRDGGASRTGRAFHETEIEKPGKHKYILSFISIF